MLASYDILVKPPTKMTQTWPGGPLRILKSERLYLCRMSARVNFTYSGNLMKETASRLAARGSRLAIMKGEWGCLNRPNEPKLWIPRWFPLKKSRPRLRKMTSHPLPAKGVELVCQVLKRLPVHFHRKQGRCKPREQAKQPSRGLSSPNPRDIFGHISAQALRCSQIVFPAQVPVTAFCWPLCLHS